jgi:adenosylcobinamide-GDP ribazoletransferase
MAMADPPGPAPSPSGRIPGDRARIDGLGRWWATFPLAWSFLTVLPAPAPDATSDAIATAPAWFPVVGVGLGALLGGLGLALDRVLPSGPVAALLLAVGAFATGGLHLDGLMDTADGVFGGRTAERRLEIMRDSRVGAFGALAGGLALLAQYSSLAALTGQARIAALMVALGMSRWAMVLAIGVFPAARATGLGAAFRAAGRRGPLVVATLIAAALGLAFGARGIAGLVVALAVALLGGRWLTARLGGLTGDTYGALAVVAETLILYAAVASAR